MLESLVSRRSFLQASAAGTAGLLAPAWLPGATAHAASPALLDHLGTCLSGDFDIGHSTFQLETPEHVIWEARAIAPAPKA